MSRLILLLAALLAALLFLRAVAGCGTNVVELGLNRYDLGLFVG